MLCINGSDRPDMDSVVSEELSLVDVLEFALKSAKTLLEVLRYVETNVLETSKAVIELGGIEAGLRGAIPHSDIVITLEVNDVVLALPVTPLEVNNVVFAALFLEVVQSTEFVSQSSGGTSVSSV